MLANDGFAMGLPMNFEDAHRDFDESVFRGAPMPLRDVLTNPDMVAMDDNLMNVFDLKTVDRSRLPVYDEDDVMCILEQTHIRLECMDVIDSQLSRLIDEFLKNNQNHISCIPNESENGCDPYVCTGYNFDHSSHCSFVIQLYKEFNSNGYIVEWQRRRGCATLFYQLFTHFTEQMTVKKYDNLDVKLTPLDADIVASNAKVTESSQFKPDDLQLHEMMQYLSQSNTREVEYAASLYKKWFETDCKECVQAINSLLVENASSTIPMDQRLGRHVLDEIFGVIYQEVLHVIGNNSDANKNKDDPYVIQLLSSLCYLLPYEDIDDVEGIIQWVNNQKNSNAVYTSIAMRLESLRRMTNTQNSVNIQPNPLELDVDISFPACLSLSRNSNMKPYASSVLDVSPTTPHDLFQCD